MPVLDTGLVRTGFSANVLNPTGATLWADAQNLVGSGLDPYTNVTLSNTAISEFIYADNFGFSLDTQFPIVGILVHLAQRTNINNSMRVLDIYVNQDTKNINTVNNSTSDLSYTLTNFLVTGVYGGSTDLWGQDGTIDATFVNASSFGVAFRCQETLNNVNVIAYIEWASIQVYHYGPLGVLTSTTAIVGVKSSSKREFFQLTKTPDITVSSNKSVATQDTYISIGDLAFRYSGGSTNSNAIGSLGGRVSPNTRITSQVLSSTTNNTKAQILDAYGNPYGDGVLTFTPGTIPYYTWTPFGFSGPLIPVEVPYNRLYTIGDTSSGQITLVHDSVDMPSSVQSDTISISRPIRNTLLKDIGYTAVTSGITEYLCIYIDNTAGTTVLDVAIWVTTPPTLPRTIELGIDPAGLGDGVTNGVATAIVANTDIPSGVSFSATSLSSPLVIGSIPVASMQAIWIKRVAPVGVVPLSDFELTDLTIEALV